MDSLGSLELQENIDLAPLTSFKVGGKARYFVAPKSVEDFASALTFSHKNAVPFFLLGQGTNLVFSDSGFSGLVIHLAAHFTKIEWNGDSCHGQAGAMLHTMVGQSVKRGLAGIQHLAGIPGTLGGGVFINAGAFGQELGEVIQSVTSVTTSGEIRTRTHQECGFSYRHSHFFDLGEIILETVIKLKPGETKILAEEMRETLLKRKSKQPLHLPNAGSMFKRPPGNYAGTLIEAAGLKGFRMGGAEISEKHANFTVNVGGATAQDIWDLTSEVILRVKAKTGITLEREVIFVGEFKLWPR